MSSDPSPTAVTGLEFSCDSSRLDVDWICRSIQGSYWGGHYSREQIVGALKNSLCFGVYDGPKQIGFLRVVTDDQIFSSITDLYVEEACRGKGIGSKLVKMAVEHERVKRTYCILKAKTAAWLFYFKAGNFRVIDRRHGIMQRVSN